MNRADKKQKQRAEKRLRKKREMTEHGGKSRYARKRAWLNAHPRVTTDGEGNEVHTYLWGFDVLPPKPWR